MILPCKHCHKPFERTAEMPRTQVTCSPECSYLRKATMCKRYKKRVAVMARTARRFGP